MTSIQATPVASVSRPRFGLAKRASVVTDVPSPRETEIQASAVAEPSVAEPSVAEPIILKESPKDIFEKYMSSHLSVLLITGYEDDAQRDLLQSTIKAFVSQCTEDLNVMLFQHTNHNQPTITGRKTCAGTRADGHACTSPFVVKGTDYCSHHDPATRKATSPKTSTRWIAKGTQRRMSRARY